MPCSSYFWLRSAGFPFNWVECLTSLKDSKELEKYEFLKSKIKFLDSQILDFLHGMDFKISVKLDRKFREGIQVLISDIPEGARANISPILNDRQEALEEISLCWEILKNTFNNEQDKNRQKLVRYLSNPEVLEALFLSNPDSFERVKSLIEQGTAKLNSRTRQRLKLGWNYLQRLCTKNDTSSFFGPIAWGRFVERNSASIMIEIQSHPWLKSRITFFEHWLILRIADALKVDTTIANEMPVFLSHGCHYEKGILRFPVAKQKSMNVLSCALLDIVCSQKNISQNDVIQHLVKLGFNENQSKELLEFLINKKVLISEITIPPGIENPLSELINKLSSLPLKNSTKKEQWLIILEKIESLRQCFEKGTLTTRIQTLNEMQLLLSNAGIDLSRDQGKMYVGRFPVYEDCGRNLYLELGGSLVQELYDQMEILMPLYTWLAGAIAVKLHDRYLDCWHGLVKDISSINDEVDFISFLSTIQANDYTEQVINEIRNLLYKCWMQVGEGSDNLEEISLSANDLVNILKFLRQEEPRADRFPCFNINVHSPDFMLSASDKQSILEGNYSIVIGEIHPAVHTVSQPVAQPFCPYKQEVRAEVEEILSPNTLIVADSPNTYQRSHIDWLDVPQLMQVVLPDSVGRVPESRCLPAGNGRVKLKNGVLTYVDQLMKVEQDILTVIPSEMHRACFELASDVIGSSLSPRIILGRMILKRRSWNIVEESLGALSQPSEDLHSYLYWRQWAKSRDMPRFVFVKLEGEPKPVYIDFCNPLSIDILANFSKRKEPMKFSEMRPAPNELWLSDSRGDYCSEFRTSWRGSKVE